MNKSQKNEVCLETEVIESLNNIFTQFPDIEKVIIYGSRAKGNYKPGSDIDLAIVSNKLTISDLITLKTLIDELPIPYKVDIVLLKYIDNQALLTHINHFGKIFYEKTVKT